MSSKISSTEICTAEITVFSGQTFEHTVILENSNPTETIQKIALEVKQPSVCAGPPLIEVDGKSSESLSNPLQPSANTELRFKVLAEVFF